MSLSLIRLRLLFTSFGILIELTSKKPVYTEAPSKSQQSYDVNRIHRIQLVMILTVYGAIM